MRTIVLAALASLFLAAPPAVQAQQPSAAPQSYRDCPQCPELVQIPPGSFMMGAAPDEHAREGTPPDWVRAELPQHKVTIANGFSLGRYEVTRREFAAFVQATRHRAGTACWSTAEVPGRTWEEPGFPQTDRDPVVCVNWNDATAYVDWLKRTTGKNYRLPSEAEWEYAARAGTTTTRYWGNGQDVCPHANVRERDGIRDCREGRPRTAPVGTFPPNLFGLHDMIGNVWEWTDDCWNDSHAGAPADASSRQKGDCGGHVLRGAGWFDTPGAARAAMRGKGAERRFDDVGFRVARTD